MDVNTSSNPIKNGDAALEPVSPKSEATNQAGPSQTKKTKANQTKGNHAPAQGWSRAEEKMLQVLIVVAAARSQLNYACCSFDLARPPQPTISWGPIAAELGRTEKVSAVASSLRSEKTHRMAAWHRLRPANANGMAFASRLINHSLSRNCSKRVCS